MSSFGQGPCSNPTPPAWCINGGGPCDGNNPPAWCNTNIPINNEIWTLVIAGLLLGIYIIKKEAKTPPPTS